MTKEKWRWYPRSKKDAKCGSTDAVAVARHSLSAGLAPVAFRYAIAAWKRISGG
jgi:hypothetical protein